jgi:hypothetical protein
MGRQTQTVSQAHPLRQVEALSVNLCPIVPGAWLVPVIANSFRFRRGHSQPTFELHLVRNLIILRRGIEEAAGSGWRLVRWEMVLGSAIIQAVFCPKRGGVFPVNHF